MKTIMLLLTVLMTSQLFAKTVTLDTEKSKIGFSIIKFKIGAPVDGSFQIFKGTGEYDPAKKELSKMMANIESKSIYTANKKRDKHLRDDDFFHVEKYPEVKFVQTGSTKAEKDAVIKGNLTMHGVTRPVELKVVSAQGDDNGVMMEVEGTINRLDFGISWNKALEKSKWKKVLGILGKTVLDENVTLKLKLHAK